MEKIIKFDESYEFCFLEDSSIIILHPVSDYFLKLDDLSINLLISLKWIRWGYYFFDSLSKELKNDSEEHTFPTFINNSLQPSKDFYNIEKEHVLLIDNYTVNNNDELNKLINDFYNHETFKSLFDQNTKIKIKLKLNLREYLIISNIKFPTLVKWE